MDTPTILLERIIDTVAYCGNPDLELWAEDWVCGLDETKESAERALQIAKLECTDDIIDVLLDVINLFQ